MKSKKIAIVSDLHANISALNTFIEYINKENVDSILNLGDYISNGMNPCELFDKIWDDKRFINIKGYDEDNLFHTIRRNEGISQEEWIRKKLGKDRLKKLELTPSIKLITINNKRILMCHINGWAEIMQKRAHGVLGKIGDEEYNYIFIGGSHRPEMIYENKIFTKTKIIDPGSMIGDKNIGNFAILDFNHEEPVISFHSIKIENESMNTNESTNEKNIDDIRKDILLYIHANKKDGDVYINQNVIQKILEIGLTQGKYICIGCWLHEKQIIRELLYHLKCRKIKTCARGAQEWYIGEITTGVKELILNKRLLPCGRIKWFEISFLDNINSITPLCSIYHYGKEGLIKQISSKETYSMKETLKKYDSVYTLLETKSVT